jgi:Domain of unknown function (DUF5667)
MQKLFNKIKDVYKKTTLSLTERDQIDQTVMKFVDSHPITNKSKSHNLKNAFFVFKNWKHNFTQATVAIVVILIIMTSVTYAAQDSLPGDLLYSTKTNVIEKIETALKFSNLQKAKVITQQINRRLEEVDKLVQNSDTISDQKIQIITEHISRHERDIYRITQSLKEKNNLEAIQKLNNDLEEVVDSYDLYLTNTQNNKTTKLSQSLNDFLAQVRKVDDQTKQVRLELYLQNDLLTEETLFSDSNTDTANIIRPRDGDTMVTIGRYNIAWESIPDAKSYEVNLIPVFEPQSSQPEKQISRIHAQVKNNPNAPEELKTSINWRPEINYIDNNNIKRIKSPKSGNYRIQIIATDFNNQKHVNQSGIFEIIQNREIAGGAFVLTATDANNNPIVDGLTFRLRNTYTDQIHEQTIENRGYAIFKNLATAAYEIEISSPNYYGKKFNLTLFSNSSSFRSYSLIHKSVPTDQIQKIETYNSYSYYHNPIIKVIAEKVLPENIIVNESNQEILLAKFSMTSDQNLSFKEFEFGCRGDSRAIGNATIKTSNGITRQIKIMPTYGGFHLMLDQDEPFFKLKENETIDVNIYLEILNLKQGLKNGAKYPREISCGPRKYDFTNRAGRVIPKKYFKPNYYHSTNILKTNLIAKKLESPTETDEVEEYTEEQPYSQNLKDPNVKVQITDTLKDKILIEKDREKLINFARFKLIPEDDISFNYLDLGCRGDSRAIKNAVVRTSQGIKQNIKLIPTHGGFHIKLSQNDLSLKIKKNEEVVIDLYLEVLNYQQGLKNGAQYPSKISCGPQKIEFISSKTNRLIPMKNYKLGILGVARAFKAFSTKLVIE